MFSRGDWAGMDEDQRVQSLQGVETREAANQGRPAATVISRDYDDPRVCGHYDRDNNNSYINSDDIRSNQPDEALNTCYHEGRHAYQHSEAANPEVADNPEYAQKCKDGLGDNYINYQDDPEGHQNQFVETDARDYAQDKMNDYNQNEGKYHSGLYGDNQAQPQNNANESNNNQASQPSAEPPTNNSKAEGQSPNDSQDNNESENAGYSY